mmetsp:Transcript_35843/g.83549  ORF Transcript_35843/g.83549 Transcript_35843/m.83549 type:complete len:217 (-) Transcript_35843:282-932(-)
MYNVQCIDTKGHGEYMAFWCLSGTILPHYESSNLFITLIYGAAITWILLIYIPSYHPHPYDDPFQSSFLQRDAVVETLISHCQISAPLLRLFPLALQRALLGNIVTLVTALVGDFCDGVKVQILGHELALSFRPLLERDVLASMDRRWGGRDRRGRPEEFEAAVMATAADIAGSMTLLDKWHERALGSSEYAVQTYVEWHTFLLACSSQTVRVVVR